MPSVQHRDFNRGVALDSVFQQIFQDFEVVLVNDGSPDTPELERVLAPFLEKHSDQMVDSRQNKRCAGARNTAIGRARGEFLAFLDSDDAWLPDHLSAQMQLLKQYPTRDLVYANGLRIGDPTRQIELMAFCTLSWSRGFSSSGHRTLPDFDFDCGCAKIMNVSAGLWTRIWAAATITTCGYEPLSTAPRSLTPVTCRPD